MWYDQVASVKDLARYNTTVKEKAKEKKIMSRSGQAYISAVVGRRLSPMSAVGPL